MKKSYIQFCIISLLVLLGIASPSKVYSQETENTTNYYSVFDQMIGKSNSGVFNGTVYTERYIVLNEKHKFFKNPNFILGSLVYDGQPYFNIYIKYDLYDDELLAANLELIGSTTIKLEKHKLSQFIIDDHMFENIQLYENEEDRLSGFCEILVKNDSMILYKKHEKKIMRKANKKIRYFEFKDHSSYYIYYKNDFFKLNKTKDFNAIFPNYKIQLKIIFDRYKSIRKEEMDSYMKSILTDLNKIMVKNNNSN